jgi:flagellar P-ring protein FlgI
MVTAALPGFSRQGTRIDVTVGAIGDAKSLQGGTLLVTPLMGADGEVYAVAQGSIAIGGFKAQGAATSIVRGVPTAGKIANGAIVEREVGFDLASLPAVRIALRNPDVTTARRIAWAINRHLNAGAARLSDPATVTVVVPEKYHQNVVELIADIEQLQVEPDQTARVVIDENNGIIVIGNEVRISTVAVAQGNLTVKITETPQVSQPGAFAPGPGVVPGLPGQVGTGASTGLVPVPRLDAQGRQVLDANGNPVFDQVPSAIPGTGTPGIAPTPGQVGGGAQTVVVPRTDVQVDDQSDRRLGVLKSGVTLGELVNGLNSLGIGPRDMISILQAVKAAGALQADIVTR